VDAQRAQEIADSLDIANVIYNGKSIYLEHGEKGIPA